MGKPKNDREYLELILNQIANSEDMFEMKVVAQAHAVELGIFTQKKKPDAYMWTVLVEGGTTMSFPDLRGPDEEEGIRELLESAYRKKLITVKDVEPLYSDS